MRRIDILKFGLFGALAAAAGTGFLKSYKHRTGVKKIFECPAPILRTISTPVDAIDEKIIRENELTATNDYAALLTHETDHVNGILLIDYEHAGLDT
jgi:peptide deformylase